MQDTSLTAIDATMYLTGQNLWPFTSDKQNMLVQSLYDDIQVKPIDIRVTKYSLEPNSRRLRHLLQVRTLLGAMQHFSNVALLGVGHCNAGYHALFLH